MKDVVFVTTSTLSKWQNYQSKIVNELFPESEHIIIDGRVGWPNVWFNWINIIKDKPQKFYIHLDEDCFIESREEVIACIERMEQENIDLLGVPDGWYHYRQNNPVAINTFFMIGRTVHLKEMDFTNIGVRRINDSWENNMNLHYKKEYGDNSEYRFAKTNKCIYNNFEPYYAFLWKLKEMGVKFDYLYPHFDDRFKSTNPRLEENRPDIAIHMWYTRTWNSNELIFDVPNYKRYELIEEYLLGNNK